MDETTPAESYSDFEESFITVNKKNKGKAIIDSDSDDEVSLRSHQSKASVESEYEDSSIPSGSNVGDSFGDEEEADISALNEPVKNLKRTSNEGDVNDQYFTDDEDEHGEIIDNSVEEPVNSSHKSSIEKKKSPRNTSAISDLIDNTDEEDYAESLINKSHLNNSSYRQVIKDFSEDESEEEKDSPCSTDEEDNVSLQNLETSLVIVEKSQSIVELSSEEDVPFTLKQTSITSFLQKTSVPGTGKVVVDQSQYQEQESKISSIEADLSRTKKAMAVINLNNLPDKGRSLVEEQKSLSKALQVEKNVLSSMVVDPNLPSKTAPPLPSEKVTVSQEQYQQQVQKINSIQGDLLRAKNAMRVIKLENLPDKGKSLVDKERYLNGMLQEQKKILDNMVVDNKPPVTVQNRIGIAWEEIEAGVNAVAPRTFGTKGVARFNAEKVMAVETLDSLHKSLETCPTENDFVDDPKGVKVPLMPHQTRALAWLLWREKQKPSGGLLADDMGLGKTLTMISLILKSKEIYPEDEVGKENYRDKYLGGTLVVCPASLINQWSGEIEKRLKRGLLSVEVYHGPKRETKAKRLAQHDVVITTYALILNENDKNGAVFGVRWRRIILDEAHQIRNHKSRTSEAVFRLSGKSRWALTGTPVHNKELDMYAIFKFLRCAPFDDLQVWKHWVGDKSTGGGMRLHAVISSLMLRRTKAELMEKGTLQSLPDRTWDLIEIKLEKDEFDIYQRVLIFSRTLFAQFLHQRAEKNQDVYDLKFNGMPPDPNGEYFKMRNKLLKLNRVKEVSQHEILVLLLRLRQICCHASLIKQMLEGDEDLGDAEDHEEAEELNLLEQLNRLNIDEEENHSAPGFGGESVGLKEASKGFLNPSNPVFQSEKQSSKIKALIKLLKQKVPAEDKAIVVSQWTSLLRLVALHTKEAGIPFDSLDGSIPVNKRMAIVDNFNDPYSKTKVLLLSLTAGGVGLNLVGANHLFLLDLHWNPQLENQAQDRIYRMGQKKPIYVYKFMAVETIEERIKALQDKKLEIANSMLTGSKQVINSKLSLQDLKMLFDFK